MTEPLLSATNIDKSYAGVHALAGASLELRAGEVHALVGENGAGKSTLIRIITGATSADAGEIRLNGTLITHNSTRLAKSLGVSAIYQQPALFPDLTVAENIAFGVQAQAAWKRVNWRKLRQRSSHLLAQVGARIDVDAPARQLSMPQQQLVEIARALGAESRVLIMDEPTASLSDEDARHLFEVVSNLKARGTGIIYVSHRLEELSRIADRVTVLRDGRDVSTRPMAELDRSELIRLMVGRELSAIYPKGSAHAGDPALEARDLSCAATGTRDVSLAVRSGEIVGLAGLVGAGRTELARTLFGLNRADSGEILVRGRRVSINNPADAIASGIAYLPEDRSRHGVIGKMSVGANISLAVLKRLSRFGGMDYGEENRLALEYSRRLRIKTPAVFSAVSSLSGGNQQKVALSRWLAIEPAVLILDEPTQGIDVGARAEIHALMSELAAAGAAILMISSDLPEILGMSDRIVVMREGAIAGTFNREEATQEKILSLALSCEGSAS